MISPRAKRSSQVAGGRKRAVLCSMPPSGVGWRVSWFGGNEELWEDNSVGRGRK